MVADAREDEVEDNISDASRDGSVVRNGSDSGTVRNQPDDVSDDDELLEDNEPVSVKSSQMKFKRGCRACYILVLHEAS